MKSTDKETTAALPRKVKSSARQRNQAAAAATYSDAELNAKGVRVDEADCRFCPACQGSVRPQKCGRVGLRWRCVSMKCRVWYEWVQKGDVLPAPRFRTKRTADTILLHEEVVVALSKCKQTKTSLRERGRLDLDENVQVVTDPEITVDTPPPSSEAEKKIRVIRLKPSTVSTKTESTLPDHEKNGLLETCEVKVEANTSQKSPELTSVADVEVTDSPDTIDGVEIKR